MQYVDWFIAFVSAVIGGLITGFFSWWYYVWSSKDLKEEIESLKQRSEELSQDVRQEVLRSQEQLRNADDHIVYLIRLLAATGQIEPRRDDKGNVLISVGKAASVLFNVKDYETEAREREERERLAREERERELSRRPFRGPLRSIWQRLSDKKGEPETPSESAPNRTGPPEAQEPAEPRPWWRWWRRWFGA
jgi:hypothetical protein